MGTPAPASTAEAMDMVLTGLSHLAAADPTAMAAQAQAECLLALEQGDAISAAARARILAAFTAGQGYAADADYSPTSWLIHRTRITKGAARAHLGWARRAVAPPAGGGGAGRGDRPVRVDGLHDLPLDRQAPGRAAARPPMRSWSPRPAPGPARKTWPRWPPRSTPGPCPRDDDPQPSFEDRRSGWRPRSPGRASCPGT